MCMGDFGTSKNEHKISKGKSQRKEKGSYQIIKVLISLLHFRWEIK